MHLNKFIPMLFASILLLTSACSGKAGTPAQDPTAVIETRVAELVAATSAAQQGAATSAAATLAAANLASSAQTPTGPTPTPEFTYVPPSPMVGLTQQTNCRSGPGSGYAVLGIMNVGESAEVVGRSQYNDYWIILLPSNTNITCWLWGQYAELRGDVSRLPVVSPPPTPVPVSDFKFINATFSDCGGTSLVAFNLRNSGSLPWESNQVSTTDLTAGVTQVAVRDDFPATFHCETISAADDALAAGQFGAVLSAPLPGLPSGHEFSATLRLCTGEGLTGYCLDMTVTFTFTP